MDLLWPYPPTRLRANPHAKDDHIKVDVSQGVVVLGGRSGLMLYLADLAGAEIWR